MTIVWHSGGRCTKNCAVTLASSGERSLVNLCSVLTLGAEVRRKLVISALDASVDHVTVSGHLHTRGDGGFLPLPSARYLGSSQYTPCLC